MDISWWAFVGVVLVAYLVPGPDFLVIMRAATRGTRPGIAAAVGAQVGLCAHVVLAVIGLSVVLARHPEVLTTIKVVGGLYLLYLGGRLLLPTVRRSSGHRPDPGSLEVAGASSTSAPTARAAFGQALATNLLNPKAVLFFAAVLPQFVDTRGAAPVWVQVGVLGAVDVALGVVAWAAVVLVGLRLARILRSAPVRRWWDRITGLLLGGVGATMVATAD
ncbi:LysE family translocator [Nocardioides sp.]|uniref:LysE family translocator n=1 Tax=Nocardioides sp. TaxID=35761 RepID=UPI002734B1C1|nr:LysE family translocator [Nocardioides sp.]MDP3894653.1 LysE family translocator [Nocardioides sp.]